MSRHTSSGAFGFLERRQPQVPTGASPRSTPFAPSNLLDDFRFNFGGPSRPEFRTDVSFPERERPPTFEEMTERFGRGQIGQLNAIAAGTGFRRQQRNPFTGQLIDAPRRGSNRGQIPFEDVPSFNIDISNIRKGINQQASVQRQNFLSAAGNRRDPRLGGAQTARINQSFGASFGAQTAANTNLLSQAAQTDIATRKFGQEGLASLFGQFRGLGAQRASTNLGQQGLRLGLEQLKVGKEGQDLRLALQKKRDGVLAFTAGQRASLDRYNAYLDKIRLEFEMNQSRWAWVGDLFGAAGDVATSV